MDGKLSWRNGRDADSRRWRMQVSRGILASACLAWTFGIAICMGQATSRQDAIAWVEGRGGSLSSDFHVAGVNDPDPRGVAFVDLELRNVADSDLRNLLPLRPIYGLSLASTQITDAGLKEVANLREIQGLLLDRTDITDAGLATVGKMPNLKRISLTHTKIADVVLTI